MDQNMFNYFTKSIIVLIDEAKVTRDTIANYTLTDMNLPKFDTEKSVLMKRIEKICNYRIELMNDLVETLNRFNNELTNSEITADQKILIDQINSEINSLGE